MITTTNWKCSTSLIREAVKSHQLGEEVITLNKPSGDFFYDPWVIADEFANSYWDSILNTLPTNKGEARIIMLKPGESYMAHADIDNRWHLNLTGEHCYLIDLDNLQMHSQTCDGVWSYMETNRIHTASNFGSAPRLQLVVRELLTRSESSNMVTVTVSPASSQHDNRYKFDKVFSPWLNQKNKAGMLADFRHNKSSVSFKILTSILTELNDITTSEFNVTYG